jgi:BolA protein
MKVIEKRIIAKLVQAFNPAYLDVLNESHLHSVPEDSETHFKVTLVADEFTDQRQVKRHQAIYACLAAELQSGVHALALHTFSVAEWQKNGVVPPSPECMGGSKKLQT